MKVYHVMSEHDSCGEIVHGIFSTREKAAEWIADDYATQRSEFDSDEAFESAGPDERTFLSIFESELDDPMFECEDVTEMAPAQ